VPAPQWIVDGPWALAAFKVEFSTTIGKPKPLVSDLNNPRAELLDL
jgi:hypothetical protein